MSMRNRVTRKRMRSLVISELMLGVCLTVFAAEAVTDGPGGIDLRLEAGKVTGQFEDRSPADVLERLHELQAFEYSSVPTLRERKISKVFMGVSVIDAVRRVLEGYDYYLITNAEGKILQLNVTNESGGAPQGRQKSIFAAPAAFHPGDLARANSPDDQPTQPLVMSIPGVPLSDDEREAFVAGMEKGLTPELYEDRQRSIFAAPATSGRGVLARAEPQGDQPPPTLVTAVHDIPPTDDERAAFLAGMDEGLTPELYESFYPETPVDAKKRGPPSPPGIETLLVPRTDPIMRLTGPGELR